METLPAEMLMVIASFLPGLSINIFCLISTRHNIAARPISDKLRIIHKFRGRLMSNSIELIMRHIYYYTVVDNMKFDPVYGYQDRNSNITSYTRYKENREGLLSKFSNINFTLIHCIGCNKKVRLNYYAFDSVDGDEDNFLDILCHDCYHRSVIGYYQKCGKLPGTVDTYREFTNIMRQTINDSVPRSSISYR